MHPNVSQWLAMIEADGRPEVIRAAEAQLERNMERLEEWAALPNAVAPSNPLGEGVNVFDLTEAAHRAAADTGKRESRATAPLTKPLPPRRPIYERTET